MHCSASPWQTYRRLAEAEKEAEAETVETEVKVEEAGVRRTGRIEGRTGQNARGCRRTRREP